ncbi:MAG: DUF4198 domain-containing protein [Candidatus Latescibacteria bacterium]|nr:DUF4198 domain-containing protein [Candidatus Latescibacterota bacterium]
MKWSVVLLAASLLAASSAAAHDLWLESDQGRWSLRYGHLHDAGDHGATALELPPGWILGARGLDADGAPFTLAAEAARAAGWPAGAPALLVATSSGVWTKSTEGTRNLPPAELAHPLGSWRSLESVKGIAAWLPALAAPLGAELELSPLTNPLTLRPGDKVTVRVTRAGAPQSDVTVAYDGSPRGVTAADGRVNVRLRRPGLQLIQATQERLLVDDVADKVIETTALTFSIEDAR